MIKAEAKKFGSSAARQQQKAKTRQPELLRAAELPGF